MNYTCEVPKVKMEEAFASEFNIGRELLLKNSLRQRSSCANEGALV